MAKNIVCCKIWSRWLWIFWYSEKFYQTFVHTSCWEFCQRLLRVKRSWHQSRCNSHYRSCRHSSNKFLSIERLPFNVPSLIPWEEKSRLHVGLSVDCLIPIHSEQFKKLKYSIVLGTLDDRIDVRGYGGGRRLESIALRGIGGGTMTVRAHWRASGYCGIRLRFTPMLAPV